MIVSIPSGRVFHLHQIERLVVDPIVLFVGWYPKFFGLVVIWEDENCRAHCGFLENFPTANETRCPRRSELC